jgi:phosphoribosylformimino-5-aminoimidazole carboxamide ribotide isomerase
VIVMPAIDLRGGACVQLVGGDYAAERVRIDDVAGRARAFSEAGFSWLHVVDLDAATGRGENSALVERLLAAAGARVQVGGGVRSVERVARLVEAGAERVIVGTRAVKDRAFLEEAVRAFPGRVVLALDVRGREVTASGWTEGTGRAVDDLVAAASELPLAALLVTAVHKEGALAGADAPLYASLVPRTRLSIIASGGVATAADLAALAGAGCAAAVVGMALYTGALDARTVAQEYGS